MKNILFLSYYYEPDLSAGSFRNSPLSLELAGQLESKATVHVFCTQPNRYKNLATDCPALEQRGNLVIHRISVPQHGNGFLRQIISFLSFRRQVLASVQKIPVDFIYGSTSKLFTGFLAFEIARKKDVPYYIDLRDLFAENLGEFISIPGINRLLKTIVRNYFEKPCLMHAAHININSEGFRENLPKAFRGSVSFFPNGIDEDFLYWRKVHEPQRKSNLITYAGNIGEAQGLHFLLPALAKRLEGKFEFLVVGDGSVKHLLVEALQANQVTNVTCKPPVNRKELVAIYQHSDYLLIHLNRHKALEKVLPSKLFEYGSGDVPILAGVRGYPRKFLQRELKEKCFCFDPGDVESLCQYLLSAPYVLFHDDEFVRRYTRKRINHEMAKSIVEVIERT